MDIKAYEFKLNKVLEKFSVPQYVITDNYNVDNLLSHLSGKDDPALGEKLLKLPILSDWLIGMLADQTKFEYSHSCSVKIFVLRLMAVVIENEVQYTKLFYSNVFDTMKKAVSSEKQNPSVQLAYINVMHGLMKYPTGVNWLLEKRSWMCVLRIYKELRSTLYLRTAAINFLVPFIWKLSDLEDERNLSIILEEVIKPLLDNPWKGAKVINNDQTEEMDRVLTPTMRLIIEIVSFPKHFNQDNLVMQILYVRFSLDLNIWDLYFTLLGENVLRYHARLAFITIFVRAALGKVRDTEVTSNDFLVFNISLCNLVKALIDKGDPNVIVDMSFFGYRYMSKFGNNMPLTAEEGKGLNVRNQLVMLSIIPILSGCKNKKEFDKEILQQYIMKLFSMSSEQMTRIYYMFRQSIKDKELGDRFTTNAIIKIIGLKDVLSTTQANIAFQALYYRLHACMAAAHLLDTPAVNILSDHPISGDGMTLLSTLLDGIYCLVEKFEISWHESVEIVNIYNTAVNLLIVRNIHNSVSLSRQLIKLPLMTNWINMMLENKSTFISSVSSSVKRFLYRLTTIIIEDEVQYTILFNKNVIEAITEVMALDDPVTRFCYIKILGGLMKYPTGMSWLLKNSTWMSVLNIYISEVGIAYVRRAALEFLSLFVWKINDLGDAQSLNVLIDEITRPLLENRWKDTRVVTCDDQHQMDKLLSPYLALIIEIMGSSHSLNKTNLVIQILYGRCNIDIFLWKLFQYCRNGNVLRHFARLSFISNFARMELDREDVALEDREKYAMANCNLLHALLSKGLIDIILDVCIFGQRYMKKLCWNLPYENNSDGRVFNIWFQLLLLPLVTFLGSVKMSQSDEMIKQFIIRMTKMSCEQTTRLAYFYRDAIRKRADDAFVTKAVFEIIATKDLLDINDANVVFQALFYKLRDFVRSCNPEDSEEVDDTPLSDEGMRLLSAILDAVYSIIEHFNINWNGSVEILSVYNAVRNVLTKKDLHNNVVVKALKLIKLTINKFLPPNLALLVDSKGTAVGEIGATIYAKLHDPNWDVRDSALELLLVIAEIALIKYPSFQKQILDENLGSVTMALAINDSESYVRATALRCLGTMFRISALWEQCIELQPDLPVKVIKMLDNETEGIIRKEAAAVLNGIYEHQKFPDHLQYYLLHTMVHAATEDLDWEVQLAALQFWKTYINKQLSNQGMLDGRFPSVTFSKEHRKIVTLNNTEIRKRLSKVLKDLSVKGCLSVLLRCLTTEYDVDVLEFNYGIVKNLYALLQQYDVRLEADPDPLLTNNGPLSVLREINNEYDEGNVQQTQIDQQKSDMVIESILSADDINLLACVYENQLNINQRDGRSEPDVLVVQDLQIEQVDPAHFISQISSTDYEKLIAAKKLWLSGSTSFHSLLDDILGEYHPSEVNDMDCY